MAGQKEISVGAKFTGDASGFEKAAKAASAASTAVKKNIRETTGLLDEVSGSVGGAVGEIGGAISKLATASTGIGAIVVLVGLLAKAWKTSQENIDLYLKSADKLAAGAAGFDLDAEKARVDTRKRANGMISEGFRIEQQNMAKLTTYASLYTDEQKKHFMVLVREGQEMQKNGRALRGSVTGISDKTDWQIKYNSLLQDQERINDIGLKKKEEWADLDAELTRNREIIADKDAKEADKKQAVINAELIANKLLKEKNEFIDRQLVNTREIADMTATQEVVEGKIADLLAQKNDNQKQYYTTMIKVDKMDVKATNEAKKQADEAERKLKALKEQNGMIERIAVAQLMGSWNKKSTKATAIGGPLAAGPNEDIQSQMSSLNELQNVVLNIQNIFQSLFMSVGGGFKNMINEVIGELGRLVAYMAAKAAIFLLLQFISGGTFGIGKAAVGAAGILNAGGGTFGKFMGFADGTNFAPGGLSLVGERGPELVNLPRGSKVTSSARLGQNMKVEVTGKVRGRDLALVLTRYQSELLSNT
jgi:hypothetical protein